MSDVARRPARVELTDKGYTVSVEGAGVLTGLSEEELRWLGLVVIPAALPPLPVPGLERVERSHDPSG